MSSRLDRFRDLGLLILRLGFGASFFWYHGLPKVIGGPDAWERTGRAVSHLGMTFGYEIWGLIAGLSEGVGGLLFAAGLFFRPVCTALLGVMIFATLDQFARADPAPEHALKNAFVFAGMFLVGPGRYTLQSIVSRRR
jgi:putative oxidoreductase